MKELAQLTLANGVELTCRDTSRPVAGDRWFVELTCEAEVLLDETFWHGREDRDGRLARDIRTVFGDRLIHTLVKHRNFIDEKDKDRILAELTTQVMDTVAGYIAKEGFAAKLFECRYQEELEKVRNRRHEPADDDDPEEEGPADFSACFRD